MSEKPVNCLIVMVDSKEEIKTKALQLLQNVTGEKHDTIEDGGCLYHTWKVKNKYFTADVNICLCDKQYLDVIKEKDINQLEAIIVMFKLSENSDVENVKEVIKKCTCESLEISLIFNIEVSEEQNSAQYESMLDWCIENGHELIQDENDDDDDLDDKFKEKTGMDRVKEALNSHVWSQHQRKGEERSRDKDFGDASMKEIFEGFEQGESFEQLFQKFSDMKEKAKSLEGDAKKEYAAQVALSFMEALGLDEDSD